MIRIIQKAIFFLLQWTWGALQNLCGFAVFLVFARKEHFFRYGALVTVWGERGASLSLGMFIFVVQKCPHDGTMTSEEAFDRTVVHEYGHSVQSVILGVFYLLVIGLPSVVWAGVPRLRRMRHEKRISYYSLYTERWANYLGEKVTGDKSMGQTVI